MKRNWIWNFLVACNGVLAAGLVYEAYHRATYLFGFPNSAGMRWLERCEEIFPSVSVLPRLLELLARNGISAGMVEANRWGLALHALVAAGATAALAYGLARGEEWARKVFLAVALVQLGLAFLWFAPMMLRVFASGVLGARGYLSGPSGQRLSPDFTILGAFVAAGIARLMWRWGEENPSKGSQARNGLMQQGAALESNAWSSVKALSVAKWTRVMRVTLACQVIAVAVLLVFPEPETRQQWNFGALVFVMVWLGLLGSMWVLLSAHEPRLGVGLCLGYAATLVLPVLGLSVLFVLLERKTWVQLVALGVAVLSMLVLFVCAIVASVLLGRAPLRQAGAWGFGVLLPFIAATVYFQAQQESTYAKMPVRSHEEMRKQSQEFERGHAAQDAVRLMGRCVFEYAAAHPQAGFPDSLGRIGPTGSACATTAAAGEVVEGHTFEYAASSRVEGGARDKFTLRSREGQRPERGIFSLPDLQVDETGIFVRLEGTRPFSFSPALALTNAITGCLRQDYAAKGSVSYPSSLRGLLSIKGQYGTPCIPAFQANDLPVIGLWNNQFDFHDYEFGYTPADGSDGKYQGFRLEARPKEYGKGGLRSYLADQSGVVHATPFPRAATANDPDAACEAKQPEECSAPAAAR